MTIPEWLKPGIYGAVFGAAFIGLLGFTWGGWMTASNAQSMANELAEKQVIAALVPICLDISEKDSAKSAKLATIRDASSFRQRDAVMEAGWATVPGADAPNRALAQACIEGLDLDES